MTQPIGVPTGLEDLIGALTSVVGSLQPLEGLADAVRGALHGVWTDLAAPDAPAQSTNWDAYTHEELHEMLQQDADVADVSAVAAEWGRHSSALAAHADALQNQRAVLQASWQGTAADRATELLGQLRDRISAIGMRAAAIQQASQAAGDALAFARKSMPPPSPDPVGFGLPAPPPAPAPALAPGTGGGVGFAFGAVAVGQTDMFTTNAMTMGAKAEAVQVMRRYESGLYDSDQGIKPPSGTGSRTYQVDGAMAGTTTQAAAVGAGMPGAGGTPGGQPWHRLVGNGVGALGSGTTPAPNGTPGRMVGVGPGTVGPGGLGARVAELTAARASGMSGFMPGMAAPKADGDRDEERRSTLPTVDHRLFTVDQRACAPVIGL